MVFNAKTINGKPIIDATRPLRVKVKAEDILDGTPGDFEACALAVGCRRRSKDVIGASFQRTVAFLEYRDRVVRYELPLMTRNALALFDVSRGAAMPGTYQLDPPVPSRSQAAVRARNERNQKRRDDGVAPADYSGRGRRSPHVDILALAGVRNGAGHVVLRAIPEPAEPFETRLPFAPDYASGKTHG